MTRDQFAYAPGSYTFESNNPKLDHVTVKSNCEYNARSAAMQQMYTEPTSKGAPTQLSIRDELGIEHTHGSGLLLTKFKADKPTKIAEDLELA